MADVELSQESLNILETFNNQTKKIEPINSGLIVKPDEKDFRIQLEG